MTALARAELVHLRPPVGRWGTTAKLAACGVEIASTFSDQRIELVTCSLCRAMAARGKDERRKGGRSQTLNNRQPSRFDDLVEALAGSEPALAEVPERPRTRSDCIDGPRPCPWVGCRHHLAVEVTNAGSIRFIHPGRALEDLPETCSLDVADQGEHTLEAVGAALNVVRERIRQEELSAKLHVQELIASEEAS